MIVDDATIVGDTGSHSLAEIDPVHDFESVDRAAKAVLVAPPFDVALDDDFDSVDDDFDATDLDAFQD